MTLLDVKELTIHYQQRAILCDVNFQLQRQQIIAIIGPSGSGKSSLINCLNGFIHERGGHYTGQILLNQTNIQQLPLIELRRQIATLFQDARPFPFSVARNLTYSLNYFQPDRSTGPDQLQKYLQAVNLWDEIADQLDQPASQLSGGQQQRLCLARLLTTQPEILILDEPCASLDAHNAQLIEDLIVELSQQYAVIFTTHQVQQAYNIADIILKIEDQKVQVIQNSK